MVYQAQIIQFVSQEGATTEYTNVAPTQNKAAQKRINALFHDAPESLIPAPLLYCTSTC
jgi:hypothetical protein